MDYGISRKEAPALVRENIKNGNLVKHCLASEAVIRSLAQRLGQNLGKRGPADLMKEKAFAAGVGRNIVMECENLGMDIMEFSRICPEAM